MFFQKQVLKPLIWFWYIDEIDDVFFIWTHKQEKLDSFLEKLNKFDSNLKITQETSKESIPFLDLRVVSSNGQLFTDLHIKSTDRHQFLRCILFHPDHSKRSIIYNLVLRVSRICSNKSEFLKHLENIKFWFVIRSYPHELGKVVFLDSLSARRRKTSITCTPFVLVYHPLLKFMDK